MMSEYKIEVGDSVEVFFSVSNMIAGIVKYKPCATGDSWIIYTHNHVIIYVQSFEQMIKISGDVDND